MRWHRSVVCATVMLSAGPVLTPRLLSQYPPDLWAITNYPSGYWIYDFAPWQASQVGAWNWPGGSGSSGNLYGTDGKNWLHAGTGWARLDAVGLWSTSLTWNIYGVPRGRTVVIRDRVWSLMADGRLFECDFATGLQQTYRGSVWIPPIIGATPLWVCSNGRELFFSVSVEAFRPHHIFAVDLQSNPLQVRPIASLSTAPGTTVPRQGATMCMGRDGKIMLLDDVLLSLDPETGVMQQVSAPYWQGTLGPPLYPANASYFAYNPWDDTAVARPVLGYGTVYRDPTQGWSQVQGWTLSTQYGVTSTSPAPFLLFGKGCLTSASTEPRLGWQGLPRTGQNFTVTLRNGEPNAMGLFWLGWSDQALPGGGVLPLDTGAFGAPGCRLLVSPDVTILTPLAANGAGAFLATLPNTLALSGYEVYAQAACVSPVNALGFVSSDAVAIRIR